jgi:hypothetical protein
MKGLDKVGQGPTLGCCTIEEEEEEEKDEEEGMTSMYKMIQKLF